MDITNQHEPRIKIGTVKIDFVIYIINADKQEQSLLKRQNGFLEAPGLQKWDVATLPPLEGDSLLSVSVTRSAAND